MFIGELSSWVRALLLLFKPEMPITSPKAVSVPIALSYLRKKPNQTKPSHTHTHTHTNPLPRAFAMPTVGFRQTSFAQSLSGSGGVPWKSLRCKMESGCRVGEGEREVRDSRLRWKGRWDLSPQGQSPANSLMVFGSSSTSGRQRFSPSCTGIPQASAAELAPWPPASGFSQFTCYPLRSSVCSWLLASG